jgi:UDP-GlcNAc3NAcA epimerase
MALRVVSLVGARPEFVQCAPVSRVLRRAHHEVLVHTGQHYDDRMSAAFFRDLGLPAADYNLGVGSGTHAVQTAAMMVRLEEILSAERPDLVIVRGDTNSTIAGALVARKLHLPLAHIEAGERSYDRNMPEEINRVVSDALADLHLCASRAAVEHLAAEGITKSVHWVGDVMCDAVQQYLPVAMRRSQILEHLSLTAGGFVLATTHRAANTDDPARMRAICSALNAADEPVVFPAHPRTRKVLAEQEIALGPHIHLIEPVGYLDMLAMEANARLIATDSGGVQREAYYLGVPCLTLREETEWVETVLAGWNLLVGCDLDRIREGWRSFAPPSERPPIYGDGHAAERIVSVIENVFARHQQPHEVPQRALQAGDLS